MEAGPVAEVRARKGGGHGVAWAMAASGTVMVVGSMLPWVGDEYGHGADGWNLFLRYGAIWDQAAVGFMDSSSVLPTGPVVAFAGCALVIDAAWCLVRDRRPSSSIDAWLVAMVAVGLGVPVLGVDIDAMEMAAPSIIALVSLVPLAALVLGWMAPYLRLHPVAEGAGTPRVAGRGQKAAALILVGLVVGAVVARAVTLQVDLDLGRCQEATDLAQEEVEAWGRLWDEEERWLDTEPGSSEEARLDAQIEEQFAQIQQAKKDTKARMDACE